MDRAAGGFATGKTNSIAKPCQFLRKLEDKRLNDVLKKKLYKEEMKAKESLEEKRARRLKEKQKKELRRRERMGWDTEYQNYTNQDNPFGDANLTSSFVWCKKMEKEGFHNLASNTVEAIHRQKQIENKIELEKVKKRRKERELERQSRDEDILILQRCREAAQYEELEKQEDRFHLEQARLRSFIRIRDGRAKPIDLLAQYVSNSNLEDTIEMQMHEPYTFVNGLTVKDLEDLLVDINVYVKLERGNNSEFWSDMTVIVEDELQKKNKESENRKVRRADIHQSVSNDISSILRGKTLLQLEELMKKVESKIINQSDGIDISYWESLLSQLKAHMARARLREKHQINLKQKLTILKKTSFTENITKANMTNHKADLLNMTTECAVENAKDNPLYKCSIKLYKEGSYSPLYASKEEIDNDVQVITTEAAEKNIEFVRKQFFEKYEDEQSLSQVELKMHQEASKGVQSDETEFAVETDLESQVYLWSDKYRPRKPRYFNRVHTGFEWNKYNQTHYDMDNPPPKIVQGYKFNIFYPDLINKDSTPQYFLSQCSDNKDFAILRFHTGPPYEDIAFKIVNREWEFSYKRGFRCQFHNNIFQLWFHFKRYRYRR